ncbi:MAG: anti-sigma factor family protein [Geminicoccaceae bacterium]
MAKPSWKRRLKAAMFNLPMMINCRQFEDFILSYFEDGLSDRERKLFEIHLKVCRECREYLAAYKASMEAAKQGFSDDAIAVPDEVPEDLVAAVIASREATD